ncbi:hypothetical protein BGZ65_004643, partial [Modicella reniformis]
NSIYDALIPLDLSKIPGAPAAVLEELTNQFLLAFQGEYASLSSNAPLNTPTNPPGPVRPTYIALCKATVTRIVFLLDKYQREKGIYASGVYAKVLKALGVAMILRYKCPPSYKHVEDAPLWRTATSAFMESIKDGIITVESLEKTDISDAQFLEIWRELITICRGTMAPALPPPTASTTTTVTVPATTPDDASQDIIQGLGITLHSTTNTMVPVRRERFAFACLEILFELCTSGQELPKESSNGSGHNNEANGSAPVLSATTEEELRRRTARVMTPVLMQRCQVLLDAYTADQALLGKCPFPRLRHQEISLVLQRLNELRLIPGVLISDSAGQGGVVSNGGDQQFDQQQQQQQQQQQNAAQIKRSVLTGPTAHLFYLFEPLTDAMFCHDPEVLLLLKACLKTAGRSIGLNK